MNCSRFEHFKQSCGKQLVVTPVNSKRERRLCFSVSQLLSVFSYLKTDFDEFLEGLGIRENRFGGDPNFLVNSRLLFRISYH